jgi:hypothetical protein
MAVKLFGFKILRDEEEKENENVKSFAPPPDEEGAITVSGGGIYGTYMDIEGKAKNETDLINKYRDMATYAECESAIDDVVNEAIVYDEGGSPVEINLENTDLPKSIKDKVREEFDNILSMLDFSNQAYEIFRQWYIDGRLYYHMMIDEKNPRRGVVELRYIDPRRIRRVREKQREKDPTGLGFRQKTIDYFIYMEKTDSSYSVATDSSTGVKISTDSIAYVTSGISDKNARMTLSHLHKAMKPLNQLRMLEDATVIYRISRAPERRIFYIDVGNLPKMKAEQYLRDIMVKYKNKLVYDAQTGEIRDDRRYQTMLEDYWLPRREGGRGTEISTLPAGQNLGELADVEYFQKKLYKALNVPTTRLEAENGFSLGRASEISRDELKFNKFVKRLRSRFSYLFDTILETQLVLKGIITKKEWKDIKEKINYNFLRDSYFSELKDAEILRERLSLLRDIDEYTGKYFSTQYIRRQVLQQSEEDIEKIDAEIQGDEPEQATEDMVEESTTSNSELLTFGESDEDQKELTRSMTRFFNEMIDKEHGDEPKE